jgi:hypothetical protein
MRKLNELIEKILIVTHIPDSGRVVVVFTGNTVIFIDVSNAALHGQIY